MVNVRQTIKDFDETEKVVIQNDTLGTAEFERISAAKMSRSIKNMSF